MTSTVSRDRAVSAPAVRSQRAWYVLMLVGGGLGMMSAGWQTVERISWAAKPSASSFCEINSVLSCSNV